jgi:hypothetical protein
VFSKPFGIAESGTIEMRPGDVDRLGICPAMIRFQLLPQLACLLRELDSRFLLRRGGRRT